MGKGDYTSMGKKRCSNPVATAFDWESLATFYGMTLDEEQKDFARHIINGEKDLIMCNAKAGTGKTTIALGCANILFNSGLYDKIIYVMSPYGEAKQGFLPGDITEKSEVYFQPLYDAIIALDLPPQIISNDSLDNDKQGYAYIYPITDTYSRGVNFDNAIVIIDEAQNMDLPQLKRILTRPKDTCKVIVCGHTGQRDCPKAAGAFETYLAAAKNSELDWIAVDELKTNHRGRISTWCDGVRYDRLREFDEILKP